MRSATDLPEDSKGTRTFLWPWVQHLAAQATAACGGNREPEQGQRHSAGKSKNRKLPFIRNPLRGMGLLMVPLRLGLRRPTSPFWGGFGVHTAQGDFAMITVSYHKRQSHNFPLHKLQVRTQLPL
jgi:hypothetical protein